MHSPYERAIKKDVTRTFPTHKMFRKKEGIGQRGLLRVLRAYSVFDP